MAGSSANSVDATKASVGMDCDFSASYLEEEEESGGWLRTTKPEGGPVPRIVTAGSRGNETDNNRSVSRVKP